MPIDLLNFVRKWNASTLPEHSAAQQHFRDLCEVLDVPHPTQTDEIGASYTFEKRVIKAGTSEVGFADVWKRGFFAWEYKSKGLDLRKAYRQLNEYHEALDNPPLLVVCDFVRFEVHTKFENARFLQWKRDHGEARGEEPILRPLPDIPHADAILRTYFQCQTGNIPLFPQKSFAICTLSA